MYEVYSMQRTGRPRWTVAAAATLLALTTGTAAIVAHHRSAASGTPIAEPVPFRGLGLRAGLPKDWDVGKPKRIADGWIVLASDPDGSNARDLVLMRVRLSPSNAGTLLRARREAIEAVIQETAHQSQVVRTDRVGTGSLGPLDSEIYLLLVASSELFGPLRTAMANVAIGPDGYLVGVILLSAGRPGPRDQKLLQEVSESITLEKTEAPAEPSKPGRPQNGPGGGARGKPMALGPQRFVPA